MSPVNLNLPPSSSSPIPNFPELKDQVLLGQTHVDHVSSQILDRNPSYYSHESSLPMELPSLAQDLKVESALFQGKSNDLGQLLPSSSSSSPQNNGDDGGFKHGYKPMSIHEELGEKIVIDIMNNIDQKNSKKWKPSKVRIMQKMMGISKHLHKGQDHYNKLQHNLEQGQHNLCKKNNNNSNGATRVCSDCRTTTTPLWRSGPQGPKSLCNACGIRQRKARRAAMAAAAATTGFFMDNRTLPPIAPTKSSKHKVLEEMREKEVDNHLQSHPLPLKKRGKTIDVDKCGFSSSNNKDYVTSNYYYSKKRAYPRDEEEGAILLMALSCSLACSS